jgi:hypothetical protein
VTRSLSREMFASFEDRDAILRSERVRDGHCESSEALAGGSRGGAA